MAVCVLCQAVDGVAVRVFTFQRSVQIRLGQYKLYLLRELFTATFIKMTA